MFKKLFLSVFIFTFLTGFQNIYACDTCGCTLARSGHKATEERRWFTDFTFEQQNWDEMDAHAAHSLHHQGHDVHAKTHEEFYHFTLGVTPTEKWTVVAEIPYVVRQFLDVEHHATLGKKLTSEGLGDLSVSAIYRAFEFNDGFVGVVGGVKFPTGSTSEKDDFGDLFEPELQPGSGSYDYSIGTAFQWDRGLFTAHGNVLYTFKTEGDQNFEYGDLFSSYIIADYWVNPNSANFKTKIGVDLNFQLADKQVFEGAKVEDSGGATLFLGPAISIETNDHVSVFGNFLFPVYQDLGGLHQEVDFIWNAGAKISW